jgi:hypothetical protein
MTVGELKRVASMLGIEDPHIPPAGPMAPFIGPQLTEREIADAYEVRTDGLDELPAAVLRSIRSFPVGPLVGVAVTCRADDFSARLRDVLVDRLPGTTWPESHFDRPGRRGLVERYQLLDGAYTAPFDAATRQAMVIELGGRVSGADRPLNHGEPFPDRITVTISHAHWCNVSGLGVGVGFYA